MLRMKRALPFALTLAAVSVAASSAQAQQRLFYMDRAQISGAPDDGYMVWRPHLHEKTRFYAMAALGFVYVPLHAETVTSNVTDAENIEDPVESQTITYLHIGTQVLNRFSVNLALPISLYTTYGENPTGEGIEFNADERMGLHDLRLDGRVKAFESEDKSSAFGLGTAIFLDTGNSDGAVAGDKQTTAYLFASGEVDFGKFLLAGNVGPHFRPRRGIVDSGSGLRRYSMGVGNELRWAFGAYVPLKDDKVRLGLELWGTAGIENLDDAYDTTFAKKNTDLEWMAQARLKLDKTGHWWGMGGLGTRLGTVGYGSPDLRVLASVGYWFSIKEGRPETAAPRYEQVADVEEKEKDTDGDGYPDAVDKCPTIKEDGRPPAPFDGCPADADRDNDGIPDSRDACPEVPEDKDGIADTDGCPEDDADNDGIADGQDKCPNEPGPASKLAEKNGCPSLTRFTEEGEIQLLEPIQFETGKSVIKAVSFPILDEVVGLMRARKDIRVGVYGHTDSVGGDASNLTLSKNRAAACVKYLVDKGIAASRLVSEGFGETKPLETNDTAEGRAKNRRTEFKVVD